jgi:MFS family permease
MDSFLTKFFINKNFALLWVGAIFVSFGFQFYSFALPVLVYGFTESSFIMSLMRIVNTLPIFIFGIISGYFIDRFNKKNIMLLVIIIEIMLLAITLIAASIIHIQLWFYFILGFSLSTCSYIFSIAKTSVLPIVVEKDDLLRANAKSMFTNNFIGIIAPSLAGATFALYSYKINFLLFMFSLIILFFFIRAVNINHLDSNLSKREKQNKNKHRITIKSLFELFSVSNNSRQLTLTMVLITFSNSLINGVLIFFALEYLTITPTQLGLTYSLSGIGGLLSSLLINKIREKLGANQLILISVTLNLIGTICLYFSTLWWVLGLSIFLRTFGTSMLSILFITIRQEITPINMLGRVASTYNMVIKGIPIIGTLLAGIWGELLDLRYLFLLSILLSIVPLVFYLRDKIYRLLK